MQMLRLEIMSLIGDCISYFVKGIWKFYTRQIFCAHKNIVNSIDLFGVKGKILASELQKTIP